MRHMPIDLAHRDGCFVRDERGETYSFHESIRDELVARGIVWRQADGLWRIRSVDVDCVETRYKDLACCDFCSGRPVTWTAACETFEFQNQVSANSWQACDPCGELIRREDRAGLFERSYASLAPDLALSLTRDTLRRFLEGFWEHWRGQIERIPPRTFGH
jgi:hypothetical protein